MFKVQLTDEVHASHHLPEKGLASTSCAKVHGHTYHVLIEVSARSLNEFGMVIDLGLLKGVLRQFDHEDLNKFMRPSTTEHFAALVAQRVEETLAQLGYQWGDGGHKPWVSLVEIAETSHNKIIWTPE